MCKLEKWQLSKRPLYKKYFNICKLAAKQESIVEDAFSTSICLKMAIERETTVQNTVSTIVGMKTAAERETNARDGVLPFLNVNRIYKETAVWKSLNICEY